MYVFIVYSSTQWDEGGQVDGREAVERERAKSGDGKKNRNPVLAPTGDPDNVRIVGKPARGRPANNHTVI